MNIIGKWQLKGIYAPYENELVLYTKDDIPEEHADVFNENKDMLP